jgi:large subunit ribosomal protein L10
MPRPEKVQAVADIRERLDGAQAVFLTEYAGLSVKEQQELRRELKANEAEMRVVKMTLARLAAEDMTDELTELLLGPTALTFADGDPAAAAKALKAFAKDHDVLVIKGGVLGSEFLSPERISALADLPSRDVLLAMVAGAIAAPMTQMAGLLAALPRNAATAFQQLLEKKEQESPESSVDSPQPADEAEEAVEEAVAEAAVEEIVEEAVAEADVEEIVEEADVEDAVEEAVVEEFVEEAVSEKATEASTNASAEPEDEDQNDATTED